MKFGILGAGGIARTMARTIREMDKNIPILFMTAKDDILSMQKSYRIGIDDYMTKPVNLDELLLRVGALLRRANITASHRLEVGRFTMDLDEHTAAMGDEEIPLTVREFNILYKLLSYPNRTFTRSQLLDDFSGLERENSLRTVDVHLTNPTASHGGCGNTAPSA